MSTIATIILAVIVSGFFTYFQWYFFNDTKKARKAFENFFTKSSDYSVYISGPSSDPYPQINTVGTYRDLNTLITEINIYLFKTKGTSDYEFIRNKVERKLNTRYDQSTVHLAFPTYFGLMGTFTGVFIGILTFLAGFDNAGKVSDNSIQNLLIGVLVSMLTSLIGLGLTTYNNAKAGEARKKIEDEKNEFYDFIQTEVTKTASASLVTAISKLHDTVDKFEPAFSTIIEGFKSAFNECTRAFGEDFKQNVQAVNSAVVVMGENMDKINENITLQKKMLDTLKSNDLIRGLDKYIEAANHFVSITLSLDKFEEARRLMLAAAQEAIALQNQYNEALKVPREIAVRVNQILDRIKDFEDNVNAAGKALSNRDVLGNDVINTLRDQINGIAKKSKIADRYSELADGKLENLFIAQTKAISEMNTRYKLAIEGHIEGFEEMLKNQTQELETRHKQFLEAIEERFSVEDVRQEFTNLRKLNDIEENLTKLASSTVTPDNLVNLQNKLNEIETELTKLASSAVTSNNVDNLQKGIQSLQKEVQSLKDTIKPELVSINKNTKERKGGFGLFGRG